MIKIYPNVNQFIGEDPLIIIMNSHISLLCHSMQDIPPVPEGVKKDRYIKPQVNSDSYLLSNKGSTPRENQDILNFGDGEIHYSNVLKKNLLLQNSLKKKGFSKEKMQLPTPKHKNKRKVDKHPFKVLDASMLQDDFYISVLDWSRQNKIAVGLANAVFLWGFDTNTISKVVHNDNDNFVSGVKFDTVEERLVVSDSTGKVEIFDLEKIQKTNTYLQNSCRVGTLSIQGNKLLTGNKQGEIFLFDIRSQHHVNLYQEHHQEVCGIKWSPTGEYFAAGGNENRAYVFTEKMNVPLMKISHKAAVRGIDWSPHQRGILATGGGTMDKMLKVWDTQRDQLVQEVCTESQICCIQYSRIQNEIISSHGFSTNEINIWRGQTLE